MRIKIAYKINGKETQEEGQINNFPRDLCGQLVSGLSSYARSPIYFPHFIIACSIFMIQSFTWGLSMVNAFNRATFRNKVVYLAASHLHYRIFPLRFVYVTISTKYSCIKMLKPIFSFRGTKYCITLSSFCAYYIL